MHIYGNKISKINLLDSTRAFSTTSPFIIFSDAYFADYLKFLAETKLLADEMGEDHTWSEISFREATEQDKERIKSALDSEGSFPGNAGWAAKRGANLSCSANLSQYTSTDVTPSKSSRSHTICLSSKRTKATLKTKRLAYIEPTSRGKSPVAEEFVKAPKDQCIIVYKRTYKNKQ